MHRSASNVMCALVVSAALTGIAACSSDPVATVTAATTGTTTSSSTTTGSTTTGSTTSSSTTSSSTTSISTTTMAAPVPTYVFPFVGREVSYGTTHHDYPAVDVFGCGAQVVAPTSGAVLEISTDDRWDPAVNDPATRGGRFVSMLGADGVRYYVAHLESVAVVPGDAVAAGDPLGVMGQTGNARNSACHTHLGISWPCPAAEWQVRRGEVWPQPYLDAWRTGEQRSPADEVHAVAASAPDACADAAGLVVGSP